MGLIYWSEARETLLEKLRREVILKMALIRVVILCALFIFIRHSDDHVLAARPSVFDYPPSICGAHMLQHVAKNDEVIVIILEVLDLALKNSPIFIMYLEFLNIRAPNFDCVHYEVITQKVGPFAITGTDIKTR